MENASKALIIAGGILLAMMILALLIYVSTSMSSVAEEQDKRILTQQIEEFNKGYLAYNKTRMYGTDVITVVNKAINHNNTVEAMETDPYYINVIIKTKQSFETTGICIDTSLPASHKDYETKVSSDKISELWNQSNKLNKSGQNRNFKLEIGEFQLGDWNSDGTLQMHPGIISFFSQNKEDDIIKKKENNKELIYYIYSALTNFKRSIFKCEEMKDTTGDGRIDTIYFSQI